MLVTAPADCPGDCEVKWIVRENGGAPAFRTSRGRGPGCGLADAEGCEGEMGEPIEWSFGILQLSGETSGSPAAIRELGTLAARGFGDMGKRARDAMIRDKLIAAQRHCRLRRHLDGVPPETPIWEIVDSCRVWESLSDRVPNSEDVQDRDSRRLAV